MRRHPVDAFSLVCGLVAVAAGALLLDDSADLVVRLRWGWPLLLVALAAVMLVSAMPRRDSAPTTSPGLAPSDGEPVDQQSPNRGG